LLVVTVDPSREPNAPAGNGSAELPADALHVAFGAPEPATGSEADADLELLDSIEEQLDEVERALARLDDDR
jgi:hypothetical protein